MVMESLAFFYVDLHLFGNVLSLFCPQKYEWNVNASDRHCVVTAHFTHSRHS